MKASTYVLFFVLLMGVAMGRPMGVSAAMESSSITGAVYCDHNHNGQLDNEEKGLQNIHVQIFINECGGTALQTIHTNKDGNFTFHGFDPNIYFIRADVPCVCGGRMPTTNTCQKVQLKEGETVILPPFGYSEYGQ